MLDTTWRGHAQEWLGLLSGQGVMLCPPVWSMTRIGRTSTKDQGSIDYANVARRGDSEQDSTRVHSTGKPNEARKLQ